MRKNYFIICICVLTVIAAHCGSVFAASQGAAFLKIAAGARAVAMGQAFSGISGDIQSLYWNPAGLAEIKTKQVFGMSERWLSDINVNSLAVVLPQKYGNLSAGLLYVSQPGLDGRDANRQSTGGFPANDSAVILSFSSKAGENIDGLCYGASVKFIQQKIENNSAVGAALDLGINYKPCGASKYQFALACRNLGNEMKFLDESFSLPLSFVAGAAYNYSEKLLLSCDIKNRVNEGYTDISVGAEYALIDKLDLRTGYLFKPSESGSLPSQDNQILPSGLAVGFGAKIMNSARLDYAFTPVSNIGDTHHISIVVNF